MIITIDYTTAHIASLRRSLLASRTFPPGCGPNPFPPISRQWAEAILIVALLAWSKLAPLTLLEDGHTRGPMWSAPPSCASGHTLAVKQGGQTVTL